MNELLAIKYDELLTEFHRYVMTQVSVISKAHSPIPRCVYVDCGVDRQHFQRSASLEMASEVATVHL